MLKEDVGDIPGTYKMALMKRISAYSFISVADFNAGVIHIP